MNVISRKSIDQFSKKHADARGSLLSWYRESIHASWTGPADIKERYPSASLLPNNMVIFNIRGNRYRLVVQVAYNTKIVMIRWIGTHAEYDKMLF
jgi:mRNA interferase HigB